MSRNKYGDFPTKTAMKPEDEQNHITSENSFGTSQQMSLQTFVKTNAVDPLALEFSLCEHPSRRGGLEEMVDPRTHVKIGVILDHMCKLRR